MNILVTGCAGFIGSIVTLLLLKQGHSVLGVDHLQNMGLSRLQSSRLESLTSNPEFSFHQLNIADLKSLRPTLAETQTKTPISAIINLAARAGVRGSVTEPRAYFEANTLGCLNLLEICKELGIEKFILASTSSVYGAGVMGPVSEDAHVQPTLVAVRSVKKSSRGSTLLLPPPVWHGCCCCPFAISRYTGLRVGPT